MLEQFQQAEVFSYSGLDSNHVTLPGYFVNGLEYRLLSKCGICCLKNPEWSGIYPTFFLKVRCKMGCFCCCLFFWLLIVFISKVTSPHAPGHWIPRHILEVIPWNFCGIPQPLFSMYIFYQRTEDNCYNLLPSCIRRNIINLLEQSNVQ